MNYEDIIAFSEANQYNYGMTPEEIMRRQAAIRQVAQHNPDLAMMMAQGPYRINEQGGQPPAGPMQGPPPGPTGNPGGSAAVLNSPTVGAGAGDPSLFSLVNRPASLPPSGQAAPPQAPQGGGMPPTGGSGLDYTPPVSFTTPPSQQGEPNLFSLTNRPPTLPPSLNPGNTQTQAQGTGLPTININFPMQMPGFGGTPGYTPPPASRATGNFNERAVFPGPALGAMSNPHYPFASNYNNDWWPQGGGNNLISSGSFGQPSMLPPTFGNLSR